MNHCRFQVMVTHGEAFKRDQTYTLIARLRHNVLKIGLRKINVSYSRISLADLCAKLALDSEEDAEGIVAKAIYDGVCLIVCLFSIPLSFVFLSALCYGRQIYTHL